MNKKIIAFVVVIVLGGLGVLSLTKSSSAPTPEQSTSTQNQSTTADETLAVTGTTYTLAEVATHKDATSCWTTISGKVYDVTAFIGRHPGGEKAILSICGKDGSSVFMNQHDGQRRPEQELTKLLIGTLK